jgi:hypothetical protein
MPSCLLLPHGSYSLMIATLASMAWFASLFQDGCDFSRVTGPIVSQLASNSLVPWLEFGIGAYREPVLLSDGITYDTSFDGECLLYPDDLVDPAWMAARAFAFLALVMGGGGTILVWFSTCFVFSKGTWRWSGYELLAASLCQGISFCWYLTQICSWNTCSMFWGSQADIIATVLWFVCGMLILLRYPPPKTTRDTDDHDQVPLSSPTNSDSQQRGFMLDDSDSPHVHAELT